MSYTLRGRLESRLAAVMLPFVTACALTFALDAWWPLELAAAMVGVGVALDAALYHRLLPYQPAWAAIPMGLLELAATMALVRVLDVAAPLEPALWFFAGSWVLAQLLGQAGLPLMRLTYGEDGGELGRVGYALSGLAPVALLLVVGVAWTTQPPTVRLAAGIHRGPLVLDRPQKLLGEPGAVVRGGIVVRSDHVIVRDVAVEGGEYGIDVDDANHVLLERVEVRGATLDAIHVRRSQVRIHDCTIHSPGSNFMQGIDISFSMHRHMSVVEGCTIFGGLEGITTHSAMVLIEDNDVLGTTLRGIDMTEMSMGEIEDNHVRDALGVGIYCGDMSMCEVDDNLVVGTRPDRASGDASRLGFGVLASYHAEVELGDNDLGTNPVPLGAVADAHVVRKD